MTLLDLYEPVFQYICMLNRIARNPGGENVQQPALREAIVGLLAGIAKKAEPDPRLRIQAQKMEMPIIFFVDSMIAESGLGIAREWHSKRLAYERNELAGDEKFFDYLEATLAEPGDEANERLAVFYVCIGLGFQGWYAGQPEYLRKQMLDISKRIGGIIDTEQTARMCREAYTYTDTRNLIEPPGVKLATIAIAFLGLCVIVLVVNFYLFRSASSGLAQSLREILRHDLSAQSAK
jgi:type VI protein secretion system component VasF